MDPITISALAGVATSLVKDFVTNAGNDLAKKAADGAWGKVGELVAAVRAKFAGQPAAAAALQQLEKSPNAPGDDAPVRQHIEEAIRDDDGFRRQVAKLVGVSVGQMAEVIHNYQNAGDVIQAKIVQKYDTVQTVNNDFAKV